MKYELKRDIIIPKGTILDTDAKLTSDGDYMLIPGAAEVTVGKAVKATAGLWLSSSNKTELNKWIKPIA